MRLFYLLLVFSILSCNSQEIEPNADSVNINDPNNGEYIKYHENGQIEIKGNLKDGLKTGLWQSYFPNGLLHSENNYKAGKLNGKTSSYYRNGKLLYAGNYENDLKSGTWYFYLEDGSFDKEMNFLNGEIVK